MGARIERMVKRAHLIALHGWDPEWVGTNDHPGRGGDMATLWNDHNIDHSNGDAGQGLAHPHGHTVLDSVHPITYRAPSFPRGEPGRLGGTPGHSGAVVVTADADGTWMVWWGGYVEFDGDRAAETFAERLRAFLGIDR